MTGCEGWRHSLAEFVAGDLSATAAAQVRAHLCECLPCRNEAAGWLAARNALVTAAAAAQAGDDDELHAALHRDILVAVGADAAVVGGSQPSGLVAGGSGPDAWSQPLPPRWDRHRVWQRMLAGVAALALFALGYWAWPSPAAPLRSLARPPLATTAVFVGDGAPDLHGQAGGGWPGEGWPGGWPMGLELLGQETSAAAAGSLRLAPLVDDRRQPGMPGLGLDAELDPLSFPGPWGKRPGTDPRR